MQPVLTVDEARALDAEAAAPVEVLIERAGAAVARAALEMLGGTYGRRVSVVAGKGNNGADGRTAAVKLARRGVRVSVLEAGDQTREVPPCHLVVDAAYGTGFRGDYRAPETGEAEVLAVDIPSGVDGVTGAACAGAVRAHRTVTFAALKPGLLLGDGPERAGEVTVADIGLDPHRARIHLVEDADVAARLPSRRRDAHKWQSAVAVVAGSGGMLGAAVLSATAALRAGAGTVRLAVPGGRDGDLPATEIVGRPLPAEGWEGAALEHSARCRAVVIGPGLGTAAPTCTSVREVVAAVEVPLVVDADGLTCVSGEGVRSLADRRAPTVLTPHDGEFSRLAGHSPGADRIAAARTLAASTGAIVLLKGPTTVVAGPEGEVLVVAAGGPHLATAGTGDVLSGMIAAFLAAGVAPLEAAALAAHVHGAAARLGPPVGLVASDLLTLIPRWLSAAVLPTASPVRPTATGIARA